jgi:outer membrane protein assembly factor BamB
MLKKHSSLLVILLALSFLLSACSGALAANGWPGLTADKTNIYVADAQRVYAVRASDNTMVWRFPSDKAGVGFFAAPQLTKDGQLIFGGFDKILYSVNPQTGVQNWTFTGGTDRYLAPVLVTDDAIYAPSTDHKLYALDFHGKQLWEFQASNMLWAQPLTDGQTIYLSSMDHFLYALNKQGQIQWKADLGGAILGTPTMSPDKILYVGTLNNELLAVNSADGSILWRFPTSGGVWATPALNGNNLYFGDMKGTFYVVDRTTHQLLTSFQPDGPIVDTPLVLADKKEVIFGTEAANLVAVDLSGKQLWSTNPTINGKLYSSPLLVGDRIVVAVTQGDQILVTLDQDGKSVVQPFTPPK